MKILIYDYLFVKGHIHPNTHYIKLLSLKYDVTVISTHKYFSFLSDLVNVLEIKSPYTIEEIRDSRRKQFIFSKYVKKQADLKSFDHIILLSYDTLSFSLSRLFCLRKKDIILQEHNNIDKYCSQRLFRIVFSSFKNSTKHIVYEEFMKEELCSKLGTDPMKVFVLPRARFAYTPYNTNKKYSAIGLSGSNSDEYIEKLVGQVDKHLDDNRNMKIILKAHKDMKSSGIVEVITNRVSDEEYHELFNSTRVVLDPLPDTFRYRMSAVLFEALSSRKIVIGSDVPIIRCFANKYPNVCFCAENPEKMLSIIKNITRFETKEEKEDFDRFDDDYSDEKTMSVFEEIMSN